MENLTDYDLQRGSFDKSGHETDNDSDDETESDYEPNNEPNE